MARKHIKKPLLKWIEDTGNQSASDQAFVAMLSPARIGEDMKAAGDFFRRHDSAHREKSAILRALTMRADLAGLVAQADPEQIRTIRLAYETGQAMTEALAYQDAIRRGPTSRRDFYTRWFERADAMCQAAAMAKRMAKNSWVAPTSAFPQKRPKWNLFYAWLKLTFESERRFGAMPSKRAIQNRWQPWAAKRWP